MVGKWKGQDALRDENIKGIFLSGADARVMGKF